ncbi:MAG: hypothetical protein ACTHM6_11170 [Tepidisphaeraceae bacterium]
MTDFLFDPPWYLPVTLGLIAVILLYQGLARQVRNLKIAGAAAGLLAVAVVLIGHFYETDQERVIAETRELVMSVDQRDWKTFKSLLDPQVRFAMYAGRDQLTAGAEKTVEQVGVKNIGIGGIETKAVPGGYDVTFTATADIDIGAHRAPTNWKFSWAKEPGQHRFVLYRIEPLPNPQFGTEPVLTRLARP